MQIIHPTNQVLIAQRNALLQQSLRPENLPFKIEEEYPIVLSPQNPQYSFCLMIDNEMAAHLNYWPRKFINSKFTKIKYEFALIGNVATAPKFRGKGLMSYLLKAIEQKATSDKIQALLLWSDLFSFYQKLGFKSAGQEYLIKFNYESLQKFCKNTTKFDLISTDNISQQTYNKLLQIRYSNNFTLERTFEEFEELIKIPLVGIFVNCTQNYNIENFFIIGKGYDMLYTVHEWGFKDVPIIIDALKFACEFFEINNIFLLCPSSIEAEYLQYFKKICVEYKKQPMVWIKILDKNKEDEILSAINDGFIWGLDSI